MSTGLCLIIVNSWNVLTAIINTVRCRNADIIIININRLFEGVYIFFEGVYNVLRVYTFFLDKENSVK